MHGIPYHGLMHFSWAIQFPCLYLKRAVPFPRTVNLPISIVKTSLEYCPQNG